jgi:glycosyltransferase involved in cell wall biosynthesis
MEEYPFVTAMIVARNEEKYIEKCFRSLLEQNYPPDRYEVLIIDGLSDDETLAIAKDTENKYAFREYANGDKFKVQVRYLHNPKKILAAGWNLGIKNAVGEYVIRIDAHGFADHDFISQSVKVIGEISDAVCVGGKMRSKAITSHGEIIANVLSSPFGVGNSKFRVSNTAGYSDTVAFGLYKKEIFERVGYFDETLKRNQDNDMHARIRSAGLALKTPIFPKVDNKRSMIYIDNLAEFVKQLIDNQSGGLFFPQNAEYVNTSKMVKVIAEAHGRKIWMTKLFNPLINLMKRNNTVNKLFGDLVYEEGLINNNQHNGFINFEESINLTEN